MGYLPMGLGPSLNPWQVGGIVIIIIIMTNIIMAASLECYM